MYDRKFLTHASKENWKKDLSKGTLKKGTIKKGPLKKGLDVQQEFQRDTSKRVSETYGVATISRLLRNHMSFLHIIVSFTGLFAKETYNFKKRTNDRHLIRRKEAYVRTLRESFFFLRLSRPPKGWQNTKTEKGKGSKITKKLQKRETWAEVTLKMWTWKLSTQ